MESNQDNRSGGGLLITGRPVLALAWRHVCRRLSLQVAEPGARGRTFTVALVDLGTRSGSELVERAPRTPAVVLVADQTHGSAGPLPSNTFAVITWRDSLTTVTEAVRLTLAGECFISPSAASPVLAECRRNLRAPNRPIARLTLREIDVMQAMVEGHTVGSTARTLGIAQKTVEAHRSRAFAKLGVRSQNEAMALLLGDPGLLR
jgi:DNA-binding NarL/FixJ family response regulator